MLSRITGDDVGEVMKQTYNFVSTVFIVDLNRFSPLLLGGKLVPL